MDPALPLILTLVLGFARTTLAFDKVEHCTGICPDSTHVKWGENKNYEERLYEASVWMCTGVASSGSGAVMAAIGRLKAFRNQQNVEISHDTWPAVISVKQVDGGEVYEVCWLIPPGLTLSSDDSVTVKTLPKTTMFVRHFTGLPSMAKGKENAQTLKHHLDAAGESYDHSIYYGAAYTPYITLRTHHDEIWIPKA